MEPAYAFSIPSIEDDTSLDCRIYHPKDLVLGSIFAGEGIANGAVLAHPYAPLGGSYDDHVVAALTEALVKQSYVVGTFNFRGAGGSAGRTTWTGKAEIQDYASFAGFLIYYVHSLKGGSDSPSSAARDGQTGLVLGGYSYGSLILARLPSTAEIVNRFESAHIGTAAAEIILRARTLASRTKDALLEQRAPASPRGRTLHSEQSPTSPSKRGSPMTYGGEETDPSDRRRSRDSRRSVDVIRKSAEVPHRIKNHIQHRRHSSREGKGAHASLKKPKVTDAAVVEKGAPQVSTSYLLISPVLLPFSNTLCPPGAPTSGFRMVRDDITSIQYLQHSTLLLFGSNDAFTASKRLRQWAEKQESFSEMDFQWTEIDGAGHFWAEPGVLQALQRRVSGAKVLQKEASMSRPGEKRSTRSLLAISR